MHVLTKFLVVLAAILCVLLSGLSIAYTSNADRITRELRTARANEAMAKAAAKSQVARSAADRELATEEMTLLAQDLDGLRQENSQLQGENDSLRAEKLRLEQTASAYESRIDQFTAIVEAQQRLSEARSDELQTLRGHVLDYTRKEIELTDRINDLDGELEVSRETNRSLQEQVVLLKQDAAGVSDDTSGGIATLRAPRGFRGRVTQVRQDADGAVMVSLNAGLSDQLRERMKLNVVRDGGFVGSVVLEVVDTNEAVGRVVLLRDGVEEVAEGDLVLAADL